MKRTFSIALILAALMTWTGGALAADLMNLKYTIHGTLPNLYQGSPMDSVLVIKGKINMGQTVYYSVLPYITEEIFIIDGKAFETSLQEIGCYKADMVPQFKSSEASGWALYIYCQTGNSADRWQKFKALSNVTMKSMGTVRVKYQQSAGDNFIPVTPGQGEQITKAIGPVQPK